MGTLCWLIRDVVLTVHKISRKDASHYIKENCHLRGPFLIHWRDGHFFSNGYLHIQKFNAQGFCLVMENMQTKLTKFGQTQWWCIWRGLYSPPGIPPRIPLESRNSAGLFTEFGIPADCTRNIHGIHFSWICLIILGSVRCGSAGLT